MNLTPFSNPVQEWTAGSEPLEEPPRQESAQDGGSRKVRDHIVDERSADKWSESEDVATVKQSFVEEQSESRRSSEHVSAEVATVKQSFVEESTDHGPRDVEGELVAEEVETRTKDPSPTSILVETPSLRSTWGTSLAERSGPKGKRGKGGKGGKQEGGQTPKPGGAAAAAKEPGKAAKPVGGGEAQPQSELHAALKEKLKGLLEKISAPPPPRGGGAGLSSCNTAAEQFANKVKVLGGLLTDPAKELKQMAANMAKATTELKKLVFSWSDVNIAEHVAPFFMVARALKSHWVCGVGLMFKAWEFVSGTSLSENTKNAETEIEEVETEIEKVEKDRREKYTVPKHGYKSCDPKTAIQQICYYVCETQNKPDEEQCCCNAQLGQGNGRLLSPEHVLTLCAFKRITPVPCRS